VTPLGQIIFGVSLGVLTAVIRLWTNYPEGVQFAIILMNCLVPLIDRHTIPRTFGGKKNA
jgi:electron transport complex protein RnfD